MRLSAKKLLPFLFVLISFFSVNQWSRFPVSNTFIEWTIYIFTIITVLWYKKKFFTPKNKKDYIIVDVYFIWLIFEILKAIVTTPDNYWLWRQLILGSLLLSLPIFIYILSIPWILTKVLRIWLKVIIPLFFLFFIWAVRSTAFQYPLGPVFLLGCFLPVISNKKWKLILFSLLIIMLFVDLGSRSQVIKAAITILISITLYLPKSLYNKLLKTIFWILIFLPILLLYLGISGQFNLFKDLSSHRGKYITKEIVDGKSTTTDLAADTRTFIYTEVIQSALKHHYVLLGRTPARGNDSASYGEYFATTLKTGLEERFSNEIAFTNVFTWLGLIGLILMCIIYIKSSYLAVYRSSNKYIKLIGLFIAFRFTYSWIEEPYTFSPLTISLWMMIAMGYSEQFRRMNNNEFKNWLQSIFNHIKYIRK